ncbi:MAG: Yip1 family protein [Anaerolineae bacterium]
MQTIVSYFRLLARALFLRDEAYAEMRDADRPFMRGLILILLVALLFSLVAIVGDTLESATRPGAGRLEEAMWQEMAEMPWFQEMEQRRPDEMPEIRQQLEFAWQIAKWLSPGPRRAALGLLINPLLLVISWLIYGLWAYAFATTLGGKANLGQTYGCAALAVSPYLLSLVTVLPYAAVGGVAITWSLVCSYLALKNAHGLSPGRAFWATILSLITAALILLLFIVFFILIVVVMAMGVLGGGG